MSKLTDEVDLHNVTAEEVDLHDVTAEGTVSCFFFNQCDWVIVSYPIIVLYCFEMSWCILNDLISVLRVYALVKSCVWMEWILRVMGRIV